jgi:hypothetical protein
MTAIVILLGFGLVVCFLLKSKSVTNTGGQARKNFTPRVNQLDFPDRVDAITLHIDAIDKAFSSGDYVLVNLSYAKLVESIRQQNVSEGGRYDDALKTISDEFSEFRNIYGLEYPKQFLPPSERKTKAPSQPKSNDNGTIINPGDNFELTLYDAPSNIIQKVKKILNDDKSWNKESLLMPLFTQYNIKCREIDDYVKKYKPIYEAKIAELKSASAEYEKASEIDKKDIEKDFQNEVINSLHERADCDIRLLFQGEQVDITVDDELIKEYGFETISKYLGYAYDLEKIRIDYERKEFEDLIKSGLAVSGDEIPIEEILKHQTLKMLNKIALKEEGFFKRKEKVIEFILSDEPSKINIGNNVSLRRIFKLKPLPEKYSGIQLKEISNSWAVTKEQIRLLVETFRDSKRYTEETKGDMSWVDGYRIEKNEDSDTEFVCLRAREVCKKKYGRTNPPRLPLHIGCNCYLQIN